MTTAMRSSCEAEIENIITSILPRQEEREKQRNANVRAWKKNVCERAGAGGSEKEAANQGSTSEEEYEVDA